MGKIEIVYILKIIFAEIIFGYLLQSSTAVLMVYIFNNRRIKQNFSLFLRLTIIFAGSMYLFRSLPVNFGVHTIFSLIVLIVIGVLFLKANVFRTTLAALTSTTAILVFELITSLGCIIIFGSENLEELFNVRFNKAVAVIPTNILFFVIVLLVYYYNTKNPGEKKWKN
ncbi:MAG TPA: hypothetical protein DCY75_09025 [Clostridiales bacterium]|jgi:hypothetical protein|nr:hypothetical protein [Clostridiales bacterium]